MSKPAQAYVHLHNHTHYSLLDGLQKVGPMVAHVKEMGMSAIAITDHGTLSGAIEFYKEAHAAGIKPIIGMETYIAPRTYKDKEPGKDKANYHLTLLASNMAGYQNLMRLSTIASLEGFYYRPRIDHNLLEQYNDGLIVLSGCIGGELGDALRQGQYKQALDIATWYKSIFKDRYYIEVQDHGHPEHPTVWKEQVNVNKQLFKLAKELDIPTVVTCDAHYMRHEDQEAHEILLCVQTGSFLNDQKRMSLKDMELHVTDPSEIEARWRKDHPEVIDNTKAIADRCNVELELGKILIPKFPVPDGETEKSYLEKLVYEGLVFRYGDAHDKAELDVRVKKLPENVLKRAEYELAVIDQMGFNGYFLIISDFIGWGKSEGIVFGPGRGSAAGSIIAYALRITELDPLAYDLLFERFLNPDRISMPDIDIDIQDTRRDEVIQYCVRKYGAERVANIVTFGKMAARNAVRDVARVLQVPYAEADRLAKMIPPPVQGRHIPLEVSLKNNPELKKENATNETAARVFDLATRLEGTIRSHGVHAAGVVIAPDDIVKFVPLEMAQKGVVATQYSMNPIEELGLLKMDFLGLSNLTIIKNALRIIKRVYGVEIDIGSLPLDDEKTFALLQRGETTGVFQLESAGMKRYLKQLKPTEFSDIIAMCALYRPGPLGAGLTDLFVARKNGQAIEYPHEKFKPALETTYGVLVYQEQVMQISKDVCGFTGGEADTLRKAIGKKKRDVMEKMQVQFIDGGVEHSNVPRVVMEKFWQDLMGFADYAFNKSHSACYGLIAYQTAYLKAHYPAAFMAALMTSDYDDTERLTIEMSECVHQGIPVLPPDVNESFVEFAVVPEKNQIRFGMAAIKNVGTAAVEEIVRARESGAFTSLEDFFTRVNPRIVNRKAVESLIKTGAFDAFGDRGLLLDNIDSIIAFAGKKQKEAESGQTDLFGNTIEDAVDHAAKISLLPSALVHSEKERLLWEKELLGLYLSNHPLEKFRTYLEEQVVGLQLLKPEMDERRVTVGGIVLAKRVIMTKSGKEMAFVKLADLFSEVEVMVFPKLYEENQSIWDEDSIISISGKINARDREGNLIDDVKVLASSVTEIADAVAEDYQAIGKAKKAPKPKSQEELEAPKEPRKDSAVGEEPRAKNQKLFIRVADSSNNELLMQLKTILDKRSGDTDVVLVTGTDEDKKIIRIPYKITVDEESMRELADLFSTENVKMH